MDCEKSQVKVMEAVGKMIHIIEEEKGREGTVEAGKSILAIIGADHTVS